MESDIASRDQLPMTDVAWLLRTANYLSSGRRNAHDAANPGRTAITRTMADLAQHLRAAAAMIGVSQSDRPQLQTVVRHVRAERFALPAFVGRFVATEDPLISPLLRHVPDPGSNLAVVRSSLQLQAMTADRPNGERLRPPASRPVPSSLATDAVTTIDSRRRLGLGHGLYAMMRRVDGSAVALSLHRARRDRLPWTARDGMIIELLMPEIAAAIEAGRRRRVEPMIPLSPRQRQTLALLLRGQSEKQIGRLLNLSLHTVHAYVKSIYKAYRVNSRAELLAKWVV